MTDRSIVVRLKADTSDYTGNITKAASQTDKASQSMSGWVDKNSQSISKVSTTVGIVGAAMTGVAVLAVSKFAQFDQAMSNVAATGDDAKGSMDALREAALEAGASTVFSATEAAGAVENLAKAGVSAEDILGGGLAGSLDLAAAGSLDVADAAEIAATAMVQFKLSGEDMGHVADLLAAGAGKAQGDVTDMAAALKQSGLVAGQFGLSIEETVGTLTAFASAGLLGSDAGTSFRTMLLRLGNPSKESAELMKEMGLSAYDASGKFVGMASVAEQLKTKLEGKTDAEKDSTLATIFGSDAIRAANVLMTEGADGITEWTNKVDDQGYAAEVASTKLDNLNGDLEKLSGAFETALIGMGEGGNGPLRSLVQGATDAVDAFGRLPDAAQNALLGIVGGGGLVLLGIAGLGKLVVAVVEVKNALQVMGITAKAATGLVAGIGGALAIGALAISQWVSAVAEAKAQAEAYQGTLDETGNRTVGTIEEINTALSKDKRGWWERLIGTDEKSLFDQGKKMGLAMEDLQGYILGNEDAIKKVDAATKDYSDNALFNVGLGKSSIAIADEFTSALDLQADALTEGERSAAQKALADEKGAAAAGLSTDAADEGADAQAALDAAMADTTTQVEDQAQALRDLVDAQSEAAGNAMSLFDAQTGLQASYQAASDAIAENGATLDITTEAGRANRDALSQIAGAGWDVVDAMAETGATQEEMQGTLATTREKFIETAGAMGLGADEANRMADEMGLIPENITSTATLTTQGVAEAQAAFAAFIAKNSGRTVNLWMKPTALGVGTVLAPGLGNEYADGGPITGTGGPRSDTVPILASPGEWVMNAAAVDHYGPNFMARVNARRYADGGEVSGWSSAPVAGGAGYASPSPSVTIDGARLTGSLDLGNGLVGVIDARVAQGMASAARSQAATRTTTGRVR